MALRALQELSREMLESNTTAGMDGYQARQIRESGHRASRISSPIVAASSNVVNF